MSNVFRTLALGAAMLGTPDVAEAGERRQERIAVDGLATMCNIDAMRNATHITLKHTTRHMLVIAGESLSSEEQESAAILLEKLRADLDTARQIKDLTLIEANNMMSVHLGTSYWTTITAMTDRVNAASVSVKTLQWEIGLLNDIIGKNVGDTSMDAVYQFNHSHIGLLTTTHALNALAQKNGLSCNEYVLTYFADYGHLPRNNRRAENNYKAREWAMNDLERAIKSAE